MTTGNSASALSEPATFHIGVAMAGAISAGAYTAGVLDVLFEALDRHNARFERWWNAPDARKNDPEFADLPRHRVVLRVISGTSAGGVSAGLSVAGLIAARVGQTDDGRQIGDGRPTQYTAAEGYAFSYSYLLEPLHYVWVEALDLYRPDDQRGLLSLADLTDADGTPRAAVSVLNSGEIMQAAETALENITWHGQPYRFLAQDFELFLTTTNLQGVPYSVGFLGGEGEAAEHSHIMVQHSAIRHFRVKGLGDQVHRSDWLDAWGDQGIGLTLPAAGERVMFSAPAEGWPKLKTASIATGAFPVGLAPQVVDAIASDYGVDRADNSSTGGAWPINLLPQTAAHRPRPMFPVVQSEPAEFGKPAPKVADPNLDARYVAVDGGVANNEPFEFARYTLRRKRTTVDGTAALASNPRAPEEANATVLMIDPFPEGPQFSPLTREAAEKMRAIVPATKRLLPALINQARFKPGELIEATDQNVHSRYLLAPSRREEVDGQPVHRRGAEAIASGSFGGFGGFLDRSFRSHDYMLGQLNARSFLKRHLTLRSDNPVLGLPEDRRAKREMVRVIEAGEELYDREMPLPVWPALSQKTLDPILEQAGKRIRDVGGSIVGFTGLDLFRKFVLRSVWAGLLWLDGVEASVTQALRGTVIAELIERDQHHDFRELSEGKPFTDWQRKLLLALARSGFAPIPVIAEKEGQPDLLSALTGEDDTQESRAHKVDALIKPFLADENMADRLWTDGAGRYTLAAMTPPDAWQFKLGAVRKRLGGLFG